MNGSVYPENKMKQKLHSGETIHGLTTNSGSPTLVEIIGYAGFDYIVIETEHAPITLDEKAVHLIRAAELAGITPLMRVRANEPSLIHKALDLGCQGAFVVHVESKEDAKKVVNAVKYPPLGTRASGPGRYLGHHRYALDQQTYPEYWNRESIVMFLIESKRGINNLEEIVSVPGIDVIGIGQGDLSLDLGDWLPRWKNPYCVKAVERLLKLCVPRGIAVRDIFSDFDTASKWQKKGVQVFEWESDTENFQRTMKTMMNQIKNNIK